MVGRRMLALIPLVGVSACVWIFNRVQIDPVAKPGPAGSVRVTTPVKAHLMDGSTLVYPHGITVAHDTIYGDGDRYDLALARSGAAAPVPLDSVLGMESFRTIVNGGASVVVSLLATGGGILGGAALAVAIFGSCPTAYADSAGTPVLQAEGFSYSVAPLFEARDVDRLRLGASTDGTVRLEVRNEALETHYINHLELLEVGHAPDEFVTRDEHGRPIAMREFVPAPTVRDRAGRDLRDIVRDPDGVVFRTDPATLAWATATDPMDYIDVALAAPGGADSVAVTFRMRNSLLNTVLLYDLMLGAPGARSLDWVGRDLEQVGPALELGTWYAKRMGMRVAVLDHGAYREVARIADTGPVAWNDIATVVPVPEGDSLRIRLSFVADDWRIDQIRIATAVRRPAGRTIPLAEVLRSDGTPDTAALANLRSPDERYLQTSPAQQFTARFDVGPAPADASRTFLLAWQGYYIEWVRGSWIRQARTANAFTPSDEALLRALQRWRVGQDSLERRFAASRIPVR